MASSPCYRRRCCTPSSKTPTSASTATDHRGRNRRAAVGPGVCRRGPGRHHRAPITATARVTEVVVLTAGIMVGVALSIRFVELFNAHLPPLTTVPPFAPADVPSRVIGGGIGSLAFAFASYAERRALLLGICRALGSGVTAALFLTDLGPVFQLRSRSDARRPGPAASLPTGIDPPLVIAVAGITPCFRVWPSIAACTGDGGDASAGAQGGHRRCRRMCAWCRRHAGRVHRPLAPEVLRARQTRRSRRLRPELPWTGLVVPADPRRTEPVMTTIVAKAFGAVIIVAAGFAPIALAHQRTPPRAGIGRGEVLQELQEARRRRSTDPRGRRRLLEQARP